MGRIVVGVDGSEQSDAALDWAVDEARLRDASVEAVYVYEPQTTMAYGYGVAPPVAPEVMDDAAQAAGQAAQRLVGDVVSRFATDEVSVEPVALEDLGPAQALVQRSKDAELLVVGSRGRGGFQELLLGSVSHQCANHAACPVVIVRHPA